MKVREDIVWASGSETGLGSSGRKRSEELGMRTITVHFDMAGTGMPA